jgi:uncharacterized membrane protein HdeD (DUF308 family)
MTSEYVNLQVAPITVRWWALVIRGLAAIAFGVLTFVAPASSLRALVVLWGAYAIVDGIFSLVLSIRGARVVRGWGWLLVQGIVSIAAGVVTFVWPGITALVLLGVIAFWAVAMGIAEIATAIRLRRYLHGEWMMILSGTLSVVFGVLLVVNPGTGALAVTWLIGSYALVFGGLLVGLGFRLHHWAGIPERRAQAA